jgi:hypothetical protein
MEALTRCGGLQRPGRGFTCAFCYRQYALRHKVQAPRARSWTTLAQAPYASSFSTCPGYLRSESPNGTPSHPKSFQAYPLSGYYLDLLSTPLPHGNHGFKARQTTAPSSLSPQPPTPPPTSDSQSPTDRMSIVFGSRLAGPGDRSARYSHNNMPPESTWKMINGVLIPPRPVEPDNCCMSGCAHCVWDDYRDDTEQWAHRLKEAQAKAGVAKRKGKVLRQAPRVEINGASTSFDDDGGGSEINWSMPLANSEEDILFADIPVGIREFMKTEKRLRQKHQQGKVV